MFVSGVFTRFTVMFDCFKGFERFSFFFFERELLLGLYTLLLIVSRYLFVFGCSGCRCFKLLQFVPRCCCWFSKMCFGVFRLSTFTKLKVGMSCCPVRLAFIVAT